MSWALLADAVDHQAGAVAIGDAEPRRQHIAPCLWWRFAAANVDGVVPVRRLRVWAARYELRRGGTAVHVEPQVFDVLAYLIAHRERVVSKIELLESVWGDRFVSESALTSRIKAARRAVGDDGSVQRTIRTVHGRGYQCVAAVESTNDVAPAGRLNQQIRFCVSRDGVRIAHASMGDGPPLVKAANWNDPPRSRC